MTARLIKSPVRIRSEKQHKDEKNQHGKGMEAV